MSFETISLLLNWVELGALLAILFRLGRTFELIAGTQRQLRRAIYHMGEQRASRPGITSACSYPGIGLHSRSLLEPADVESTKDDGDFAPHFAVK